MFWRICYDIPLPVRPRPLVLHQTRSPPNHWHRRPALHSRSGSVLHSPHAEECSVVPAGVGFQMDIRVDAQLLGLVSLHPIDVTVALWFSFPRRRQIRGQWFVDSISFLLAEVPIGWSCPVFDVPGGFPGFDWIFG